MARTKIDSFIYSLEAHSGSLPQDRAAEGNFFLPVRFFVSV